MENTEQREEDESEVGGREGGRCELGHVLQHCQRILWVFFLKNDNETRVVSFSDPTSSVPSSHARAVGTRHLTPHEPHLQ